ncbi:MAG: FkbM family methyltransferase [Cyclobacteriaceae bacterium]
MAEKKLTLYARTLFSFFIYFLLKARLVSKIRLPGIAKSFSVRPSTSDVGVFRQIFKENQYKLKFDGKINTIIDAGANIGLASVLFANLFEGASISAIEPDRNNYNLLKKNLGKYNNCKTFHGAIWNKNSALEITDSNQDAWSFTIREANEKNESTIEAFSIDQIMEKSGFDTIDLLKIDIEGSEKEVFEENYSNWLPKTKYLVIELHDDMRMGASRAVFRATSEYNFSCKMRGENLIFTNQNL